MAGERLELCIGPALFLLRVVLLFESGENSQLGLKNLGDWAGISFGYFGMLSSMSGRREREVVEERWRRSQRLQTRETEEEEDEGSFCKISCSSSSYKLFTISLSDSLSLCVLCSCGELRREMNGLLFEMLLLFFFLLFVPVFDWLD